jgi:hypothetical protein
MFAVISKITGETLTRHFAYAPLEQAYADAWDVFVRNEETGVEWDVGYQSDSNQPDDEE